MTLNAPAHASPVTTVWSIRHFVIRNIVEVAFKIASLGLRSGEKIVESITMMKVERRDCKLFELCVLYLQGVLLHQLFDHNLFQHLGLLVCLQDMNFFSVVH